MQYFFHEKKQTKELQLKQTSHCCGLHKYLIDDHWVNALVLMSMNTNETSSRKSLDYVATNLHIQNKMVLPNLSNSKKT